MAYYEYLFAFPGIFGPGDFFCITLDLKKFPVVCLFSEFVLLIELLKPPEPGKSGDKYFLYRKIDFSPGFQSQFCRGKYN